MVFDIVVRASVQSLSFEVGGQSPVDAFRRSTIRTSTGAIVSIEFLVKPGREGVKSSQEEFLRS